MSSIEDIMERLLKAATGSCTCLTKSPVVSFHALDCEYRAIMTTYEDLKHQNEKLL